MFSQAMLKRFLSRIKSGELSIAEGLDYLKYLPYEDLGFAKIDHHRHLRRNFPEVIFAPGKDPAMLKAIVQAMLAKKQSLMVTKTDEKTYSFLKTEKECLLYHAQARMITSKPVPIKHLKGTIAILTAGTSDISIAEEARLTCQFAGCGVKTLYDVGVAGIHRLISHRKVISFANVIIVIAGMEGALASVVGGLTEKPVIAVPTSIGYGAHFKGISALLTMLNSCAPGVCVVNIDNGFGAGYLASMMTKRMRTH